MHKVLILGGSGLLGTAFIGELNRHSEYRVHATYFDIPLLLNYDRSYKLSIEDPANLCGILDAVKPHSVVSCLRGDFNKQLALHARVAEYLRKTGGRLYFLSTVNVFDSDRRRPHDEGDAPDSCTDYGQYKIACEKSMTGILRENACILRLPQVWGAGAPRLNQLLRSLQNEERIVVYPKLFFNATTDVMVAKQLRYIMEHRLTGIFHLAAEDVVSHRDFYKGLITGLGFSQAEIKETLAEEGYFALASRRKGEFPGGLRLTNQAVIDYVAGVSARSAGSRR